MLIELVHDLASAKISRTMDVSAVTSMFTTNYSPISMKFHTAMLTGCSPNIMIIDSDSTFRRLWSLVRLIHVD
jgi:hypothetical protein